MLIQKLQPVSLFALLATLILIFGFQGKQILNSPLVILLLSIPILIQVVFNSGLAYLLNRITSHVAGYFSLNRRKQLLRTGRGGRHRPV